MDPQEVILYPVMTEVSSRLIEKENRLVFIVNMKATKADVKRAVEELYDVAVEKVNLLVTPRGEKKAFVKLHPEYKAVDVAIKLGIL
ncbi:MAG TPA: 50S ribosomal protein L23 [Candidatus Bathyarchaeota archaeon]|nr:MAG: 50S ribosomal protein L23 [Candidatus Bathyarchaeota archaeon]HDI06953.1 50S ribosomal protein L23 [Candidatus Bathyarchaeota archaeon]